MHHCTYAAIAWIVISGSDFPIRIRTASRSEFETIEGRQPHDRRLRFFPPVNFRTQIGKLVAEILFADFYPPGLQTAVASVRPAITPRLQVVLHLERAVFGKDADARALAGAVELGERAFTVALLSIEDFQERVQSSTARWPSWKYPAWPTR